MEKQNLLPKKTYSKPAKTVTDRKYTVEESRKMPTLAQMRLYNYSLLAIDPNTETYSFILNCRDYCTLLGIDSANHGNLTRLKNAIDYHQEKKVQMVRDPETGRYYKKSAVWFPTVEEIGTGNACKQFRITVNRDIAKSYTMDPNQLTPDFLYSVKLQTLYGLLAWEEFHSLGIYDEPVTFTLEEFASIVGAMNYFDGTFLWANFRKRVIEPTVADINENALDISVTWQPNEERNEETGKKRVVSITFIVHRIFEAVAPGIIQGVEILDPEKLDQLKAKVDYARLCELIGDTEKAEFALRIICTALQAIEQDGNEYAVKFDLTGKEMLEALNMLTAESISRGITCAYNTNLRIQNIDIHLLRCILDAQTGRAPIIGSQDDETVFDMASLLTAPPDYATGTYTEPFPAPQAPEKDKKSQRQRTTKAAQAAARAEAEQLVDPQLLERQLLMPATIFEYDDAQKELIQQSINDFYAVLTRIFSTKSPHLDMGKGQGNIATNFIRMEIRSNISIARADAAIQRFMGHYDDLKNPDEATVRQNYMLKVLWNGLYDDLTPKEEE